MSKSMTPWDDVHGIFTNADEAIKPPNKPMVAIISKANSKILHGFETRAEALDLYEALSSQMREHYSTSELAIAYGLEDGEAEARALADVDARGELVAILMRMTLGLADTRDVDVKTELRRAWREAQIGDLPFDEDGKIAHETVLAMLTDFEKLTTTGAPNGSA